MTFGRIPTLAFDPWSKGHHGRKGSWKLQNFSAHHDSKPEAISHLKDQRQKMRGVIPIALLISLAVWLMQKLDGFWRMTMDYFIR